MFVWMASRRRVMSCWPIGYAARQARLHHAREEFDRLMKDVHDRLAYAKWQTRETILEEIDEVKETLSKIVHRFD